MINGVETEFISVRDRGLQYGDGCFETLRLINRFPVLLNQHIDRLIRTCQLLQIEIDLDILRIELTEFIRLCPTDGVVKIILTRGIGGRGYTAPKNPEIHRIFLYSEYPENYSKLTEEGVSVGVSGMPLSENSRLAGHKHLNRLDQVIASFDLHATADEVLCMDSSGHVIEGSKSNLVLVLDDLVITPNLEKSGVKGVMLDYLRHRYANDGNDIRARDVTLEDIRDASELFLCNSVFGVLSVAKLIENEAVKFWPIGPVTRQAMRYYQEVIASAN